MTDTQNLNAALELAAATPLVRKGVDVENAYKAAQVWTYIGDAIGKNPRDLAALFKLPLLTMLIHYSGEHAKVVPVEITKAFTFEVSDLFPVSYPMPTPPTIVHLNKLEQYARDVCEGYLRDE
jgi:hypothetical protein